MRNGTNGSAKRPRSTNRVKSPLYTAAPLIAAVAVLFTVFTWAVFISVNDPSGWSGLLTGPVIIVVSILLIACAAGFGRLALKLPNGGVKHQLAYWLGALIAIAPIILLGIYIFVGNQLDQAAQVRRTTPIALQNARQLVTTCQVESLRRNNGGAMQLKQDVPVLLGKRAMPEQRTFSLDYFDELLALVRSKDVQDKCGFVPVYDLNRTKVPEAKKWITQAEAETILRKCLWSTRFYVDDPYFPMSELPGPNTTGILLSQRLGPWNDDTESTIRLINASEATKAALQKICK